MNKPIDGTRVRDLRKRRNLSQKELADKAKISKDSLSRIERSRQSGKARNTVEGLAKALDVSVEVLAGDAPMPAPAVSEGVDGRFQINVRVSGAIRNAFSLAVLRYRIPVGHIVALAPFLFVVAAEQSLRRRSARLADLEGALNKVTELGEASRSFLLRTLAVETGCPPHLDAERKSIKSRDILASGLDKLIEEEFIATYGVVNESYDAASDNPFVESLRESAAGLEVAEIQGFWFDEPEYSVCRNDAVTFAGGDEEAAQMILDGRILVHEIPLELRRPDALERRRAWLRQKVEMHLASRVVTLDELLEFHGQ